MIQWGLDGEWWGGSLWLPEAAGAIWFLCSSYQSHWRPRLRDSARGAVIRGLAGSAALTLHPLTFKQATFGDFSQDLF